MGGNMDISELSSKQLATMAKNYRAACKTEGGKFPLSVVLREQLDRKPATLDTLAVARSILEQSRASPDGLVTNGELWNAFNPDTPWSGHGTQSTVKNSLGRVVGYCVDNGLPIISVLVVPVAKRKLTDAAIRNIYGACRELGVATGNSAREFAENQIAKAKMLSAPDLPPI
jgi:hypothetical protein